MAAPLWTCTQTQTATTASTLTITAPSSGVSASDVVFVMISGETAVPTAAVAFSGTGVTYTTHMDRTTVGTLWMTVASLDGVDNSDVVTATITGGARPMRMGMMGYAGLGVGNTSAVYTRPASQATIIPAAFTAVNSGSTIVDFFGDRHGSTQTFNTVSTGTIRQQAGSGSVAPNTLNLAFSDFAPGSTTVPAVTGTYASATANGAGIQIEVRSTSAPVTITAVSADASSDPGSPAVSGEEVVTGGGPASASALSTAPIVRGGQTVIGVAAQASSAALPPTVFLDQTITASRAQSTSTSPAPALTTVNSPVVAGVRATANAFPGTTSVAVSSGSSIGSVRAQSTATARAPGGGSASIVVTQTASATAATVAPALALDRKTTVVKAQGSSSITAPSLVTNNVITITYAAATAQAGLPAVSAINYFIQLAKVAASNALARAPGILGLSTTFAIVGVDGNSITFLGVMQSGELASYTVKGWWDGSQLHNLV